MDLAEQAKLLTDDTDATKVLQMAPRLIAEADRHGNLEAAVRGRKALGLALLRTDSPAGALEAMDQALELARGSEWEVEIQMSRVGPLTELGRFDDARVAASLAVERSTGLEWARASVQRATLEFRVDARQEIPDGLTEVESVLRAFADDRWLLRLWLNRAHMKAFLGDYAGAEQDIALAMQRARLDGDSRTECDGLILQSEFSAHRGDIVYALRLLEEADEIGAARTGHVDMHRGAVMLAAHLVADATAAFRMAIEEFDRGGFELARSEAGLALAEALQFAGASAEAHSIAIETGVRLEQLGRTGWIDFCRFLELETAAALGGEVDTETLLDLAEAMVVHGLVDRGIACGLRALELAGPAAADRIDPWLMRARSLGRTDVMIQVCHIQALRSLSVGEVGKARRHLRRGLELFQAHQDTLGATETRVHAARGVQRLGTTALRLAVSTGGPTRLLRWMELTRAGALRHPPVIPPRDSSLAADLAELRSVESRVAAGESSLAKRESTLRQGIRRRMLSTGGEGVGSRVRWSMDDIVDRLDGGGLVAFDVIDARLVAVGITRRGRRIWDVGSVAEMEAIMDGLRFSLQRLAGGRVSAASAGAAWEAIGVDSGRLFSALVAPLGRVERLVLSPPGRFHALPVSVLNLGIPTVVTPSIELWIRRSGEHRNPRDLLVAGPGLMHADREIELLAKLHPQAAVLVGGDATVVGVAGALDGVGLAHLACHGVFRSDNPLFSSLMMADGGLNAYEIQRLDLAPDEVVLSACDVGRTSSHPGNEQLGLASAMLGGGTRTVVASVGLFPDSEAAISVMTELHRELVAGRSVVDALAAVEAAGEDRQRVARMALVAFGAG